MMILFWIFFILAVIDGLRLAFCSLSFGRGERMKPGSAETVFASWFGTAVLWWIAHWPK